MTFPEPDPNPEPEPDPDPNPDPNPEPDQATEEEAERGLQAERAEKRALCQERDALKEQARAAEEGPHLKPKPYALSPKP